MPLTLLIRPRLTQRSGNQRMSFALVSAMRLKPKGCQWKPKYGWRGTVTACCARTAFVAWKCWLENTQVKVEMVWFQGRSFSVLRAQPRSALIIPDKQTTQRLRSSLTNLSPKVADPFAWRYPSPTPVSICSDHQVNLFWFSLSLYIYIYTLARNSPPPMFVGVGLNLSVSLELKLRTSQFRPLGFPDSRDKPKTLVLRLDHTQAPELDALGAHSLTLELGSRASL